MATALTLRSTSLLSRSYNLAALVVISDASYRHFFSSATFSLNSTGVGSISDSTRSYITRQRVYTGMLRAGYARGELEDYNFMRIGET